MSRLGTPLRKSVAISNVTLQSTLPRLPLVTRSGGIWRYMAISGVIWRYLAVSGRYLEIWRYLGDLAVSGSIWEISGGIGRSRAVSGSIYSILQSGGIVSGSIWRYMAVSGGICERSEVIARSVETIQRAATSKLQQGYAAACGDMCRQTVHR